MAVSLIIHVRWWVKIIFKSALFWCSWFKHVHYWVNFCLLWSLFIVCKNYVKRKKISAVYHTLHLNRMFQKYPYPSHGRYYSLKPPPPIPLEISSWNFIQPHGVGMDIFCYLAMFGQIILWSITNNKLCTLLDYLFYSHCRFAW